VGRVERQIGEGTMMEGMNIPELIEEVISGRMTTEQAARDGGVAPSTIRKFEVGFYPDIAKNPARLRAIWDLKAAARDVPEPELRMFATRGKAESLVKCDCGHTVIRSLVMTTSHGTACPDCYDAASD
jgi:hypothetical protein